MDIPTFFFFLQVSKESEILMDMPQALRAEVALFVHRNIIQRVPFLSELGDDVVPSLVTRLRPLICFRGDVIIQEVINSFCVLMNYRNIFCLHSSNNALVF